MVRAPCSACRAAEPGARAGEMSAGRDPQELASPGRGAHGPVGLQTLLDLLVGMYQEFQSSPFNREKFVSGFLKWGQCYASLNSASLYKTTRAALQSVLYAEHTHVVRTAKYLTCIITYLTTMQYTNSIQT